MATINHLTLEEDKKHFKQVQVISLGVAIVGIIIGGSIGYFLSAFSIGVDIALVSITLSFSVRNWYYFSQLDSDEIEQVKPFVEIFPWLTGVILALTILLSRLNISLLWVIATVSFVGMLNVWLPRSKRKVQLQEAESPISFRQKYEDLRKKHYEYIGINEQPKWEDLRKAGINESALLNLQLTEAIAIYAIGEFIKPKEDSWADKVSWISAIGIPIMIQAVGQVLGDVIIKVSDVMMKVL